MKFRIKKILLIYNNSLQGGNKMVTKWYNPLHDCEDFGVHYIPADYDVNVVSRFSPSMIKCMQTTEKYVDIPEEILHYYMKYRETPLRPLQYC